MFSSEDSRIGRTRVSVIAVPARAGSALAASAPAVSAGYLGARRPRRFAGPIALAAALAALATALAPTLTGSAASHHGISAAERQRVASAYARLPLSFEENRGQSDSRVRFLAHGPGYGLFFTSGGPVLALRHSKSARSEDVVGLRFLGGNPDPSLSGVGRLPGTADYLIGSDRSRWRTGLPTFSGMRYQDLWPGVGVEFYGNASRLEYDLHLAPGADPARVGFSFVGARSLRLMASGGLSIGLPHGSLDQARPFAYQWLGSRRQPVSVGYAIAPGGRVGLRLGAYDHRRALIVDPGLIYSTYLGGSGSDFGKGIAVDASGDAYVTG